MRAIQTTLTNETENYQFSHWIEPLDDTFLGEGATMGDIYRASLKEYGRCTGKVYVDVRIPTNDHGGERWETRHVGWFFVKRARYEDTGEPYLQGAWVTVGEHVPATPEHLTYNATGVSS